MPQPPPSARGLRLVGLALLVALEALLDARERGLDLAQREARGRQLAGQELGLGLRALVDEPILLGAQPVALGLAVLRQQDERRRVGGLRREREVEQEERRVVVEAEPEVADRDPRDAP